MRPYFLAAVLCSGFEPSDVRQAAIAEISRFRDGAGETLVPREVVERVSAAATAPTYGFLEQYVGRGIVGGDAYSR